MSQIGIDISSQAGEQLRIQLENSFPDHRFHSFKTIEDLTRLSQSHFLSVLVVGSYTSNELLAFMETVPDASTVVINKGKYSDLEGIYKIGVEELIEFEDLEELRHKLTHSLERIIEYRALRRMGNLANTVFYRLEHPFVLVRKSDRSREVIYMNNAFRDLRPTLELNIGQDFDPYLYFNAQKKATKNRFGSVDVIPSYPITVRRKKYWYDVNLIRFNDDGNSKNHEYEGAFLTDVSRTQRKLNTELRKVEKAGEQGKKHERFLANIAHDLRKPLNNIIGLAEILEDSVLSKDQEHIVSSMSQSSQSLLTLVNDLLDFAKIESGNFSIITSDFNVRDFAERLVTPFIEEARNKGLAFHLEINQNVPVQIQADKERINQLLTNLLSNAIKFTREGSIAMEIYTSEKSDASILLHFAIKDSGIGIKEDQQKEIFKEFNQGNADTDRKFGGTGLGLAICRKLSSLMDGSLKLESAYGEGSTFTFTLPLDFQTLSDDIDSLNKHDLQGLNVLIVDDKEINLLVLEKLLKKWQANVIKAKDGYEAIKLNKKHDFDLILMDLQMPGIDGYTTAAEIGKFNLEKNRVAPILAVSAYLINKKHVELYNTWINDYVLKPIVADNLFEKIQRALVKLDDAIQTDGYPEFEVVDAGKIHAFANGDPVFINQLVSIFLKRTPEYMEELKDAVHRKDWDSIKRIAHKVKPTFTYVGMERFTERVGNIEKYAIEKDISTIKDIMDDVWSECQIAFEEFRTLLEHLSG